jgi:site-specific DNA-methyltransferase (adenine-specific)
VRPYYTDDTVTLWHGDMREVIGDQRLRADLILADPPYGETSLGWDRWPQGWLGAAASASGALWCFGSLRAFTGHHGEFASAGWKLSQDVVGHDEDGEAVFGDVTVLWEKQNGTGFHADRFRRVHEWVAHWYTGAWSGVHRQVQTTADAAAKQVRRKKRPPHMGYTAAAHYVSADGGPRLMRSVIKVRNMHGRAVHPTQKPVGLLDPLLRYGCPPGGVVLDPFAGSGSTAMAARMSGRRAVLIEGDERYCEVAARALSQEPLPLPLPG